MRVDTVYAWIAIGAAASLAGMIWPFRRGVLGVVLNFLAGIGGAVVFALISYAFEPRTGHDPFHLIWAAVGAIVTLYLMHAIWMRITPLQERRSMV